MTKKEVFLERNVNNKFQKKLVTIQKKVFNNNNSFPMFELMVKHIQDFPVGYHYYY